MASAKVLVLLTSPLDKIAHALRAVEAFHQERPDLEITWVTRRVYEPLVKAFPFVSRVIVFHRTAPWLSAVKLVREIRQERYDFVLDFEGLARTGAMCAFARSKRKLGLATAREGATVCYGEVIASGRSRSSHVLELFQEFGSALEVEAKISRRLAFPRGRVLPKSWREAGEDGLRRMVLCPGRFKTERAWPHAQELAARLVATRNDVAVFFSGPVPYPLISDLPERVFDLQRETDLPTLCEMLLEADVCLANDNGPAQLAGALGCPNLTLYSFVFPERRGTYPFGAPSNRCLKAPGGEISAIEIDQVQREIESLLLL